MSAGVELTSDGPVRRVHGVKDATLDIKGGEFFSFLAIGLRQDHDPAHHLGSWIRPKAQSAIGGQDMNGIGPNKRPTALIFQNLALFPLMSVAENITYGLRVRAFPKPIA